MSKKIQMTSVAAAACALAFMSFSAAAAPQGMQGTSPVPGTCKVQAEAGVSGSPLGAQQIWTANVASKFGSKWAHWVGAKNKVVVPMNGGLYQAVAKPCFYQPVP